MSISDLSGEELLQLFCDRTGVSRADALRLSELSTALINLLSEQDDPVRIANLSLASILHIVKLRAIRGAN